MSILEILASTPSPYKSYVYEKVPSIRITSISLPVAIKIFARRLEKVYLNFFYFQHPDEIIITSEDGKQYKANVKLPDFIMKANSACDMYQALFQDDIKNSQDDVGLVAHWIEVFEHEWQTELNEMKQKEIRKGIIPFRNKKPQIKWYPLPEISTDKKKKKMGKGKEKMPSLESIHKDKRIPSKDGEKSNIFKPAISWADDVEEEFGEYFNIYKDNGYTIQEQETSAHFQNSSADASLEKSTSKETEAGQSESESFSRDNEQNCESEFVRKHVTEIVEDKSGDSNAQNIKIGPSIGRDTMLETSNTVSTSGQLTLVGEGTKVNETVFHENQNHNERLQTNKDLENNQAFIKDIQTISVEVNPEEMKSSMNEIEKGNYKTNIKEEDKIEEQIKSFEDYKAPENKKATPEEGEQEESQDKIAGEISNVTSMKQHRGGFDEKLGSYKLDQSIGNAPEDISGKFEFERRNSGIGMSETNLINQGGKSKIAIQQKPEQNSVGKRPIYISHTFKWSHGGNKVYLAGSFYTPPYPCWTPISMKKKESGEYEITIMLKPDQKYLYKFIIDGEWRTNPGDPVIQDKYGNENHYVILSLNEHGKPMLAAKECQTFPCTYSVPKPGGDKREQDESEFMGSEREQDQDMVDLKESVSHLLNEHAKFIYKELEKEFKTRNKLFEMDKVPHISAAPTGKMKKTGQKKRYHEQRLKRHDHSLCGGSLANRERTVNKMRKVMNRWEVVLKGIKDVAWLH